MEKNTVSLTIKFPINLYKYSYLIGLCLRIYASDSMADEVNFFDLMTLKRITPETIVEKFGGLINSSFFDASNILGTLKLKGLVDFTTTVPGQNAITITQIGSQLLKDADAKAAEQFDELDLTILNQLAGGKRSYQDLSSSLNIRPRDLAMHLYKMAQQQHLTAEFRNGNIDISLTEKGFIQAKSGMPKPQEIPLPSDQGSAQQGAQPVQPSQPQAPGQTKEPQQISVQEMQATTLQDAKELKELENELNLLTNRHKMKIIAVVVVVVILVFVVLVKANILKL